jgi:hypothetical protein
MPSTAPRFNLNDRGESFQWLGRAISEATKLYAAVRKVDSRQNS